VNLNHHPTKEQLRELIKQCDDSAGHHILWVKKSGEVQLASVPKDRAPVGFEQAHPEMQLRCETFLAGNEYVGPEAAADDEWVSELFDSLSREWAKVKGRSEIAYIDAF
jgi:hypothetical protein